MNDTTHCTELLLKSKYQSPPIGLFREFPEDPAFAIRDIWKELRRQESTGEAWMLSAIARKRMALLEQFPERDIPGIIDSLNSEVEGDFHYEN